MNRTKDEFRKRWRSYWGMLVMEKVKMLSSFTPEGKSKAEAILDMPAEIDSLLDRMYEDLAVVTAPTKPQEQRPAANGGPKAKVTT